VSTFPFSGKPLGVQVVLSVTNSAAVGLTVPAEAAFALISVETESVRYRDDGVAPTNADGVLVPVTTAPWCYASEAGLSKIKFIATSATATLNIAFYGT
jgi:hypothetical protein